MNSKYTRSNRRFLNLISRFRKNDQCYLVVLYQFTQSLSCGLIFLCLSACEDQALNSIKTTSNTSDQSQITELFDLAVNQVNQDMELLVQDALLNDQARIDAERPDERPDERPNEQLAEPVYEACQTSANSEHRLNIGTNRFRLEACHSPRLLLNLASSSRWKLELTFDLSGLAQLETQVLTPMLEALIELKTWRVFDSFYWREYLDTADAQAHLSTGLINEFTELSAGSLLNENEIKLAIDIEAGWSGQHIVQLYQMNGYLWTLNQVLDIESTLTCLENCHLQSTLYPIVLVHGYAGVDQYFGVLDYFYRVPNHLREQGFLVYVPSLSSIELSSIRASELSAFLDEAQAESGAQKFNLIAHSQGGLDSRFLISSLRENHRIASLTTIATPHYGLPVEVLDFFSRQSFAEAELDAFNQTNPDDPKIRYFSWSARTCTLLEWDCLREHDNEIVTPFLLPTYTLLSAYGPNDGLVMSDSMIYGEYLGELSADHFDQIGQIADQNNGAFPHLDFYTDEAQRLLNLGF